MNHEHTIPIAAVVSKSIFLAQAEKGENICNAIFVDINLCVAKISNLCCGYCSFVAMDFDRQLNWPNILDMFEIQKKGQPSTSYQ
jgi:hypothetical protein